MWLAYNGPDFQTFCHEGRRIQCTVRTTSDTRDLAYDAECSKTRMSTLLALGKPYIIRYTMLCVGWERKFGFSMTDEARSRDLTSGCNQIPQICDVEKM